MIPFLRDQITATDEQRRYGNKHDLDPWGGETGGSSNQAFQPHEYTTYERDSNGGDEAMHRRYQAYWNRFSQPDPYDGSYDLTDPQSLDRYAYVQNDPVNFIDPSGLNMEAPSGGACFGSDVAYYIDGVLSDSRTACRLLESGGGVVGPASTTRWNADTGNFEFFHAMANGSGWIPMGAHYIGGLNWGWTDYSRDGAPSYTYSFTEDRLSQLVFLGSQYAFDRSGTFWGVHGEPLGERGLDMHPAADPVWVIAGAAAGGVLGAMRSSAQGQAAQPIRVYSAKVLLKAAQDKVFHGFPASFDNLIFQVSELSLAAPTPCSPAKGQ